MEQNYKDAIKWLDLAAEKGDAEAQFKLGKILSETGIKYLSASIKQDYKDAMDYYPNMVEIVKGIEKELNDKKSKIGKKCKVGDIVKFGSYQFYPFYKHGGNVLPIEWRVLDVKDNKALLITKYGIDCKPYNEEYIKITWENCSLRRWLNDEFYTEAFSAEEQETIVETWVEAEENPEYHIEEGSDTKDKVFLLNIREANEYFSGDDDRLCVATKYAKHNGCKVWGEGLCRWLLRSPGYDTDKAAHVDRDGPVDYWGAFVNDDDYAVRPALWVNLSSL